MLYCLLDLFLAGVGTTSTAMTWEFLLLALHPEIQEKVHQEIKEKIGTSRLPALSDRPA
jgi:cytochrome P450 family 2 subfamily D